MHGDTEYRPKLAMTSEGYYSMHMHALVRFGRWDDIVAEPLVISGVTDRGERERRVRDVLAVKSVLLPKNLINTQVLVEGSL